MPLYRQLYPARRPQGSRCPK